MITIDERVGCIAVVETDLVVSPGLGPDYPGVLWFASGRPVTRWDRLLGSAGPHDIWIVPRRVRRAANRALARLSGGVVNKPTCADWLRCPNCDNPVAAPCGYEDGEPLFDEYDGVCEECWAIWRVSVDVDEAHITWDGYFADRGQGYCDGTCSQGAVTEYLGTPCARDCDRPTKVGTVDP